MVAVRGELDLESHERLADELADAAKGDEPIVVDLTACEFIDSSGVRALLLGQRAASNGESQRFSVAGPGPQVSRILEMTGVGNAVPVHGSLQAALDSLA